MGSGPLFSFLRSYLLSFIGGGIVEGLLSIGVITAARESIQGNFLIVPEQACLKSGHTFLDDLSLEDLEHKLDTPVAHGGGSFLAMVEQAARLESQ